MTKPCITATVIVVVFFVVFFFGCEDPHPDYYGPSEEILFEIEIEKAREEYKAREQEIRQRALQGDDLSDFSCEELKEWAEVVEQARLEKELRELENSLDNFLPDSSQIEASP